MDDKFDYFYDGYSGHWIKDHDADGRISIVQFFETALSFFCLAVCLVAVMMLFLCG